MDKYLIYDGMKSYDAPMNMPEAWTSLGQQRDASDMELASKVAAVYRVRDLLSNAVSNVPFAIYQGEEEIDNSADWQNTLGFLPNPVDLIRRWRLSLMMSNAAYAFATKVPLTAKGANLQFLVASTIEPLTDKYTGDLTGFKRHLGTRTMEYSIKDRRIIYLWKLDETTELLPSAHTEFKAMCNAAGIMYYADAWTANYFKRGGVKPTIIGVKGVVSPTAKEDLEKGFSAWIKRLTQPAKAINADAMQVEAIGDGIAELKDMSVYKQAVVSVCSAVGISPSLILSDFANYATAQVAYWQLYKDKVNPDCQFIQELLNDQIFEPLGYRMEFNTEAAEPNQEEEVQRASAFKTYVDAGIPLEIAAQIVGVEMPEGYDYDALKEAEEEKKEQEAADKERQMELQEQRFSQKHYGPGEHPGTGTGQEVHSPSGAAESLYESYSSDANTRVISEGGEDVAFYSGAIAENPPPRIREVAGARPYVLSAIGVFSNHQGRGFGKTAIRRVISDAINKGASGIVFYADGDAAASFYDHLGANRLEKGGYIFYITKKQFSKFAKSAEPERFTPSLDQIRELNRWQVFAFRKLRDGKSLDFPFRLDFVPEAVGEAIRARLTSAKTEEEIKAAFDLAPESVTPTPDYTPLIKSIELGVEALAKMQAPIVVNNHMPAVNIPATQVTFSQPEVKYDAPTIMVNVPEQKPPSGL